MIKDPKMLGGEPDPIDVHLGKKLRDFRTRLGWTLANLAERAEVSHQQIHKYEGGQAKISASMLYNFSLIFSTTLNAFFEGYTPKKTDLNPSAQNDTISLKAREKINLLLVEDSSADEFLIRKILETCPYDFEIYCIHSGDEAIHYFKKHPGTTSFTKPDIVLLDLNLPKVNGFSVLRAIKQDRSIQDIPVLVLTNSLSKKDMVMAYKNFASGYISKSFDSNTFRRNLQTALTYWIDAVILPESSV